VPPLVGRRLHEFCKSNEANECYGWAVDIERSCYPPIRKVAKQIRHMLKRHGLKRVFLATDSPDARVFEDVLRKDHGIQFEQASADPVTRAADEW
jgi:hypothetical protein